MLEEEHAVVVADRRLHQPLRVGGRRRIDDLEARRVDEGRFGILRVERTAAHVAAARPAHHHRTRQERAVARRGDVVREHVVGAGDEVDELHLAHRPHAHVRRAGRRADDPDLARSACRSRAASPNVACRPSVTLNAPPYAPMSSPMQKTFASRSISSNSACADRLEIGDLSHRASPSSPDARAASTARSARPSRYQSRLLGRIGVEPDQRIERLGQRRGLGLVRRRVDLARARARRSPRARRRDASPSVSTLRRSDRSDRSPSPSARSRRRARRTGCRAPRGPSGGTS